MGKRGLLGWATSLFGGGKRLDTKRVQEAVAQVAGEREDDVRRESQRLGPLVSRLLDEGRASVVAGRTTQDVADALVEACHASNVEPAMLGFNGYPSAAAVSVNEEIVHGIPSPRVLRAGDLVKVELGTTSGKGFAAQSWTFPVGDANEADARMLAVGRDALRAAVSAVGPSSRLGDIGEAIQTTAEAADLSVVRAYVGYGIGKKRIQPPQIPGFGKRGTGPRMRRGWILNIHVILKRGSFEVDVAPDGWTTLASDSERGVLFTSMVEVTAEGRAELTRALDT